MGKNVGGCLNKYPIGVLLYTYRKVDITITHNINMKYMKRKNKASISHIIRIALLIFALTVATSTYYTSDNDRTGIFPQELAGLKLVPYVDGADTINDS